MAAEAGQLLGEAGETHLPDQSHGAGGEPGILAAGELPESGSLAGSYQPESGDRAPMDLLGRLRLQ